MSFWRSKDKADEALPPATPAASPPAAPAPSAPLFSAPLFSMGDQRGPSPHGSPKAPDPMAAAFSPTAKASALPAAMPGSSASPPAEETKARDALANQSAAAFGKITSVLMHCDPVNKHALADLAWLVAPAVVNGTYSIAETRLQTGGPSRPAAVTLWACVSDEVDRRLTAEIAQPLRLQPQDWKSGENYWLIHASGESRAVQKLVDHLVRMTFAGRTVKVRTQGPDGRPVVGTLAIANPKPA